MGALVIQDEEDDCAHVRVYDEQALLEDSPIARWECLKCRMKGEHASIDEITYRHDQLKRG